MRGRRPLSANISPSMRSARPYPPGLEAVSTTLPPPAVRVRSIALSAARYSGVSVRQSWSVPSPTMGNRSPLLGIGRVMIGALGSAAAAKFPDSGARPNPPASVSARRRVNSPI
jgi:hypothetical protein